jgi:ATP-dependent DNA helicase RecG
MGDIMVRVYDNRITVGNPGELPEGITVDELRIKGHRSLPRNPFMAKVLYYSGLIEKWGTGTTRIITLCNETGLPEPQFESGKGWFEVEMSRGRSSEELLDASGLKERQLKALKILQKSGKMTVVDYEWAAGVSRATAKRDLTELVDKGIILRLGSAGRNVCYTLGQGENGQTQ